MSDESLENRGHALRGFAAITVEERKRISSLGGKAAHAAGTAHEWNHETGQAAGRKGGAATHAKRHSDTEKDLPATPDEA